MPKRVERQDRTERLCAGLLPRYAAPRGGDLYANGGVRPPFFAWYAHVSLSLRERCPPSKLGAKRDGEGLHRGALSVTCGDSSPKGGAFCGKDRMAIRSNTCCCRAGACSRRKALSPAFGGSSPRGGAYWGDYFSIPPSTFSAVARASPILEAS